MIEIAGWMRRNSSSASSRLSRRLVIERSVIAAHGAGGLFGRGRLGAGRGVTPFAALAQLELGLGIEVLDLFQHVLDGPLVSRGSDEVRGVDVDHDMRT